MHQSENNDGLLVSQVCTLQSPFPVAPPVCPVSSQALPVSVEESDPPPQSTVDNGKMVRQQIWVLR